MSHVSPEIREDVIHVQVSEPLIEDLGVVPLTKPLLVSHVRPAIQPQMVMPCTAAVLRKIGICDWKTASCCASLAWLTSYSVM